MCYFHRVYGPSFESFRVFNCLPLTCEKTHFKGSPLGDDFKIARCTKNVTVPFLAHMRKENKSENYSRKNASLNHTKHQQKLS